MTAAFHIAALDQAHDRSTFVSGSDALDRYFRELVTQDIRRRICTCYVAVHNDSGKIAGFYTLAAASVPLTEMPESLLKRLPRYPSVPAARMGRLAVDQDFQKQKLGAALLWDAALRALRSEIAAFSLIVDAKDENAVLFYRHHGFLEFGSLPNHLMLPLAMLNSKTNK